MPLEPRGASYYTDIVKSSAEANGAIGGATRRGGNAAPPRPSGALSSVVKNNIIAQIQFLLEDNMPGPPGPPGPAGPTGPPGPAGSGGGGSYTPNLDIWGGSPPATAEEAINRLAAMLYLRTVANGAIGTVPTNATVVRLDRYSGGSGDVVVVKYDTSGIPQWARRIGGTGDDRGVGIASDSSGNVYVTGFATGAATVFAANETTVAFSLANAGSNDAFIVKYDTSGTPQWARRIGGTGTDQGMGIATDSSGNVYVTGYLTGAGTVFAATAGTGGNLTGTDISLANAGVADAFIVKYATDGLPLWARRIGGTGDDRGLGIATDSSGNVYVTGLVTGATVFATTAGTGGNLTGTDITLSSTGNLDAFVVKYATDGLPLWARRISGTTNDQGMGIATDSSGNVYVNGYVTGTFISVFAADDTTATFTTSNSTGANCFITKYSTTGTPLWISLQGPTINTSVTGAITSDSNGNVYMTGLSVGPFVARSAGL